MGNIGGWFDEQADSLHKRGIQLLRRRSNRAVLRAWAGVATAKAEKNGLIVRLWTWHVRRQLKHALQAWCEALCHVAVMSAVVACVHHEATPTAYW